MKEDVWILALDLNWNRTRCIWISRASPGLTLNLLQPCVALSTIFCTTVIKGKRKDNQCTYFYPFLLIFFTGRIAWEVYISNAVNNVKLFPCVFQSPRLLYILPTLLFRSIVEKEKGKNRRLEGSLPPFLLSHIFRPSFIYRVRKQFIRPERKKKAVWISETNRLSKVWLSMR